MFPISKFDWNGFACPIPVMKPIEAAALADQILRFQHEEPEKAARAFGTNTHLLFPSLCAVIQREQILDAVEQVLGRNLLLWSASFFIKSPKTNSFVSWHQDSTYWGLEPPEIVTAWLALTPSNRKNGCMEVVPGSHLRGQISHHDTFGDNNMLSRGQKVSVDISQEKTEAIELEAGQMSLHHVRIFHGSKPNPTDIPRIGFAMRFIPTQVKQKGGRTFAVLVRGQDVFNNFDRPTLPRAELGAAEWEMHQESLKRMNTVLFNDAAKATKVKGHQILKTGEQFPREKNKAEEQ